MAVIVLARKGESLAYFSKLFKVPIEIIEDANLPARSGVGAGKEIMIPGYTFVVGREERPVPVRMKPPLLASDRMYDYQSLLSDLETLLSHYPFLKAESIGKSVLGKELFELRVGRGNRVIHYNGSFHANEWITSAILMNWVNDLLFAMSHDGSLADRACLPFYRELTISIVPMVNPDGVDLVLNGSSAAEGKVDVLKMNQGNPAFYSWKANINGVDLNNQFPANWEVEKKRKIPQGPAARDYPGDSFLTEPEAIAMKELAENRDFERMFALHTQGKEFYWGYEGHEPEIAAELAVVFEERSGYRAVRYIDSHAGYKDWFIQEFKRAGFTLELGKGINPLPPSHLASIYPDVLPILVEGLSR